jgi:hypothetical protein
MLTNKKPACDEAGRLFQGSFYALNAAFLHACSSMLRAATGAGEEAG